MLESSRLPECQKGPNNSQAVNRGTVGCVPMKNPHAVALGRLGGKAKSRKKKRAVRANGKLGGRPKKEVPAVREHDIQVAINAGGGPG